MTKNVAKNINYRYTRKLAIKLGTLKYYICFFIWSKGLLLVNFRFMQGQGFIYTVIF